MEKLILAAALSSRDDCRMIRESLEEDTLSQYGNILLKQIQAYWDTDKNATSVNLETLNAMLEAAYPKHWKELRDGLSNLPQASSPNIISLIKDTKREAISRELAGILVASPKSPRVAELLGKLDDLEAVSEEVQDGEEIALAALTRMADTSQVIKLYPKSLNDRLEAGARAGNHIVMFARSNCGKTAFNINLARGLLRDGRRVLYIMNEEPTDQVMRRLIARILNTHPSEVDKDPAAAVSATKGILKNLVMVDMHPGTFSEIRGLIKKVKPEVVIIDQLRNIRIKEDSRVLGLEKLAVEARNVGKEFGVLMVSVTQASDSARDKLRLDDGDIDFSNTGIPGAADLIIGMGVNDEYRTRGRRMLTIVKNKLGSNHDSFPVTIDEGQSKLMSL